MREEYENYKRKYNRTKLMNMILVSMIVGILIGGVFTYGLFRGTDILNNNIANASDVSLINDEYESPVINVAEEVLPSIVMIKNIGKINNGFSSQSVNRGTGSGIIYSSDGYIITNQHVIDDASEIEVVLHDGEVLKARVLGQDAKSDLAVIKVDAKNLPMAKLGDSDNIKVGQLAVAIGNPMGENFSGSVTSGIISALNRTIDIGESKLKLIQTDAAINPGNSGGALANKNGEVIGINSAKLSSPNVEGMGFAIPINDALPIIDELISNGYVKRPWIGVMISDITDEIAKQYDLPKGVYIRRVNFNSPAEEAGLRVDDIITEIEGKRISNIRELSSIMEEYNPEDTITIKIYRDKSYKEVKIKLGIMPPQ